MQRSPQSSKRHQEYLRARLSAVRGLTASGLSVEQAEQWCDAWEVEAERQELRPGSDHFWAAGRGWIDAQRSFRKSLAS
jgi:hypothetical protein